MLVQLEDPQLAREAALVTGPSSVGDQLLVEVVGLPRHHESIGLVLRWILDWEPGHQTLVTGIIPEAREHGVVSMPPQIIKELTFCLKKDI